MEARSRFSPRPRTRERLRAKLDRIVAAANGSGIPETSGVAIEVEGKPHGAT